MAHFSTATALAAYDGRSHILGASMLAAVDQALRIWTGEAIAPFQVMRAKFTRKTGNNGRIVVYVDEEPQERPANAAAEVYGVFAGRKVSAYFLPEAGLPPVQNLPSGNDLSGIQATADFNGECTIRAGSLEPLLRCLVDANKLLHLASPAMLPGKVTAELLFIENLCIDPALADIDSHLSLRNINARNAFGRLVTLAELRFHDHAGTLRQPRISMSFQAAG